MKLFWKRVISNKSRPYYWPVLILLWLASLFFRFLRFINGLTIGKPIKLDVPVVSIGNLTVGGAGKTPLVIKLGQWLVDNKYTVGIVAAGYGRSHNARLFAFGSELRKKNVDNTGDEPALMALALPEAYFGIGAPKWLTSQTMAKKEKLDVILLDDGYQHRKLHRDMDILAIDSGVDLRRESIFPLGRLRESISGVDRADAVVLTKYDSPYKKDDFIEYVKHKADNKPIAISRYTSFEIISESDSQSTEPIKDKNILAFSGLADNEAFERTVRRFNPSKLEFLGFADHCRYSDEQLGFIDGKIKQRKPDLVLTTHKDYVKVKNYDFAATVYYIPITVEFDDGFETLTAMIQNLVKK